jgi:cytochrome c553
VRGNLGLALTTVAVLLLAGAAMPHALAGSTLHPTDDQLETMADAVDWYPGDHTAAPNAVLHGSGKAGACGYCHLPNGAGRPKNASLAGLDA